MMKARCIALATALSGEGATTPVGRALQKHAVRSGSAFVGATGDAAQNTAIGRQYLMDILNDPLSTVTFATHKVFGNVIRVRRTDGSGVWFRENGELIGFLERYTPRELGK
jgi:filamentous hemagglutinin